MLRRILISLLVLFVLAALLIPLALGFVLERGYPDLLARVDQSWAGGELRLARFDRGWFSSRAEGVVQLPGEPPLPFSDRVSHGPLPWGADSATPAWIAGRLAVDPAPLVDGHLVYRVNLDMSVSTRAQLQHAGEDADGPRSGPLSLTVDVLNRGEVMEFDLQSQQLDRLGPAVRQIAGTMASGSFRKLESGFWAVDVESQIGNVELVDSPLASARDVTIKLKTVARAALAALEVDFSTGQTKAQGVNYGQASAVISLANIDEAALARLLLRLGQGGDAQTRNAAIVGELIAQVPILVGRKPRFVVRDFAAESEHGPLSGNVDLTLVDADPRLVSEPVFLLAFLQGTANLELPIALARHSIRTQVIEAVPEIADSPEWVQAAVNDRYDELLSDGLFVQRGGTLSTQVEFGDGVAVINGKTVQLPTPLPQ